MCGRRPGKNFLTDDIGRAQMVPEVRSNNRAALSAIAPSADCRSVGELEIIRSTSEVAVSRSSASSRSRRRRADSLSARIALALRRFGTVLRLRALVGLLPGLERRRIAHPKGLGLRRFSKSITAGF